MKALLLAAGLGSRLRPITNTIPKCLVPINDRPLLGYWLDLLQANGITEFYINLHYHAQSVRDYVASTPYASMVTFIDEAELLGTGGTLKQNADLFSDAPFFVAHADNLCLCDFKSFIKAHKNKPKYIALTMMTFNPVDASQCGVVSLNQNNIVTSFHEKVKNPPSNLANGAVFVMDPEVANFVKNLDKTHFEISRDVIPNYVGKIKAWHNDYYHLDIGTPQAYQKAKNETHLIQNLCKRFSA